MNKKLFITLLVCMVLTQCHTLRSDCEALREREAAIAQEEKGEYFVGRRYYIPSDQGQEAKLRERRKLRGLNDENP